MNLWISKYVFCFHETEYKFLHECQTRSAFWSCLFGEVCVVAAAVYPETSPDQADIQS